MYGFVVLGLVFTVRHSASMVYAIVVCLSQVGVLLKQLNMGSCKHCHIFSSGTNCPRL